ncbi:hypothetical protein QMZ05_28420 [Bradyrhizobium sp. INPA03-11B]|uniref:hypothetical protein n=1 Tax=Bradyrhizobium sp. INPA03-11B TaxID=418598 RepID=UPI00338E6F31
MKHKVRLEIIVAKNELVFEIDDTKTVDQNICALSIALKGIDDPLAGVLSDALSKLSLDIALDQDAILDALYLATAPVEPQQMPSEEGAAQ